MAVGSPPERRAFGMRPATADPGTQEPAPDGPAPDLLPADAVVDLAAVRQESGIDGVFATLDDELVGLAPVKARIAEVAALLLVDRTRERFGIHAQQPTLHMCFTGSPGTAQ